MNTIIEAARRHLDVIDPTRAHARVGVQGALSVGLALALLSVTALWPTYFIWVGYWALMVNVAILSGPGSFWHEARIGCVAALCHGVAILAGSYAHLGSDWFFPAVGVAGFLSGLGIAFGVTGNAISVTSFVSFAFAATIRDGPDFLADRAAAGGVGVGAAFLVLTLVHLIGRRYGVADLGRPPPQAPDFRSFPNFERGVLLHAFRFMVTALAATAVASLLDISHPLWIMLTIAVVLQRRVGETLRRGAQRLAGTLIGAVMGWAIAFLIGPEHTIWLLVLIPFILFGIYFYAPANYVVCIAFVTAFVLFVYALTGQPLTESALERLFDTLIAGAIGIVVSLVLIPESAVTGARIAVADFFRASSAQYRRALALHLTDGPNEATQFAPEFEETARLAAKEVAIAQWEAIPGRRIAGMRHDMRRLIGVIYDSINRLTEEPAENSARPSDEDSAFLMEEAEQIGAVFAELESALRETRAPDKSALRNAQALLDGSGNRPFGEFRQPLFQSLADFLTIQEKRFPPELEAMRASS